MEADIGRPDNTELSTRSDGTRSSRPRMDLRSLPLSAHYFWDDSQPKHMNHTTTIDKASTSGNRNLPENEIAVMALNEVAADRGRGFFFHFRNRDCWKKAKGDTCPTSRTPILQPMFARHLCLYDPALISIQAGLSNYRFHEFRLGCAYQGRLPRSFAPLALPEMRRPV